MAIPSDFFFTQSNLQDYLDCPRRFELRHILKINWPSRSVDALEDFRNWMEMGNQFHQLLHQYFIGIPPELLQSVIKDPELWQWWQNFLTWVQSQELIGTLKPEVTRVATVAGQKVMAKFDLVIQEKNRIRIIDWKTTRHKPDRKRLAERIQSKLYPLIMTLSTQDSHSEDTSAKAENVEMIYWFANYPDRSEMFDYNSQKFEQDRALLTSMIHEINQKEVGEFPLTQIMESCKFCSYRSLCNRGHKPGTIEEALEILLDTEMTGVLQSLEENLDQINQAWL